MFDFSHQFMTVTAKSEIFVSHRTGKEDLRIKTLRITFTFSFPFIIFVLVL